MDKSFQQDLLTELFSTPEAKRTMPKIEEFADKIVARVPPELQAKWDAMEDRKAAWMEAYVWSLDFLDVQGPLRAALIQSAQMYLGTQ